MTVGPPLPCPRCRRTLEAVSWRDAHGGRCWRCQEDFGFTGFPALAATPPRVVPQAVLVAEHATCFYHSTNQAEVVCETCGRFLCAVCAVEFMGRRRCPTCIETAKREDAQAVSGRVLYDGIALAVAVLPLLVWFVTCITAPIALCIVIAGWRKPRSLVQGSRTKLMIAGVIALLETGAWVFGLVMLWLR